MSAMTPMPVVAGIEITTDERGRFNLNALHRAYLALNPELHRNSKQPADWLKLEGTKDLIAEISNSEDLRFEAVTTRAGRYGGTFAHELLAISYAGWISPAFQLKVNQVFLDYRAGRLRPAVDPMAVLTDPAAMRGLLLTYTEKVLTLEEAVKTLEPKAEALDRIAASDGGMCITNAAKDLQIRPKDLFARLREQRWIYRRPGGAGWVAYQDKLQAGLLAHKVTTVERPDGTEKTVEQVLVTPRGLAKLAGMLGSHRAA